jgi:hypothetical protein
MRVNDGVAIMVLSALATGPVGAQALGWMQVATTGPSPRYFNAMAYDSQRGKTVLFGGEASANNELGDTWEWDGATWRQVIPTNSSPHARCYHAMAYDSVRGVVVLFGGWATNTVGYSDTWEWDGTGWTQAMPTGQTPSPRYYHAMAYDSQRGRTVVYGGLGMAAGPTQFAETWEWDGASWSRMVDGPSARWEHAMAFDNRRGRTVLYGGSSSSDTWEWDGSTWTVAATTGPGARIDHAMCYDAQRGVTVMFGGVSGATMGDTWEWGGASWTEVDTTGPAPRYALAMAFDDQRGRTIVFGGQPSGFLDTWERNIPPAPATAVSYGGGCGSPALTLSPSPAERPTTNQTAQVLLANVPTSFAYVAIGWSRTMIGPFALPFPLAGYGMPGCDLLQSTEISMLPVTATGSGTATLSLPIPYFPALIGLHVYLQAWAYAPGANAGDLIVSNGIDWGIGNS